MTPPSWGLVVAGPVRRAISRLPAKVAVAVLDFLVGPLVQDPHRVGKALRGDLAGCHAARVGAYRVIYEIEAEGRVVRVLFVDHRADIYRPR
ncbi:MAG: type II toxin-antitoxin system RelE/ParE family toxin [Actinobacteria bacterium]|nr:type II toxin-antitoxin system RelE/ParE family toxin [Actinomycetota bacterium]